MKIVRIDEDDDGTEVYEPSECYFGVEDSSDGVAIAIVPIEFWNENLCLSDGIGDQSFDNGAIPDYFSNIMEAIWDSNLSIENSKKAMIDAGFKHFKKLDKLVKESY